MVREFDLEKRTTEYAKAVIRLCRDLPVKSANDRLTGQVVGAAGSVGANYREANDALGKKDFVQRLKIARREAKESLHWLELIVEANIQYTDRVTPLLKETEELKCILSHDHRQIRGSFLISCWLVIGACLVFVSWLLVIWKGGEPHETPDRIFRVLRLSGQDRSG